ncbi:MAG: hypothetical protein HOV87_11825 [Catenulispora sp.]|nr:hypothetical protein [Catenulispora sp.]NUT43933.1 hypothetical protein [Thermoactinospora sp.]
MSKRYEIGDTGADLEVIDPADPEFWDEIEDAPAGRHALVIGNPWASAYAIVGSHDELRRFAADLNGRLTATDPTRPKLTERELTVWVHTEELWRDLEAALGLLPRELGAYKPWARLYPKHVRPDVDLDKAITWAREHGIPYTVHTSVHHHGTTGTVDADEYLTLTEPTP